jgi:aspartate carbamoyltransferase catalytic subunit
MNKPVKPMHVLKSDQFDRAFLDHICSLTDYIRRLDKSRSGLLYLRGLCEGKRAMLYFTQPSTRTFLSFQTACQILGVSTSEIRDSSISSERKGESIEDSLRTFSSYVDLIIMRTPTPGMCDKIADTLDRTPRSVPIINAGSGPDQHPTQAILDIYTLSRSFRKLGGIESKTIMMVGDLKRGRTIRSLSLLLRYYEGVKIIFSSPEEFRIDQDLREKLKKSGVNFEETTAFKEPLSIADAVYMTRVQDEYDTTAGESRKINSSDYHLKFEHLSAMKSTAVIMHPFPRRNELDVKIDDDPRAKYWRQERNGMWTRAALITMVLGMDQHIILPQL